jgi:enoyl-CoA hydratase
LWLWEGITVHDRYQGFGRLTFDQPVERVLRVTMQSRSANNRVDEQMHRELIRFWRAVDEDEEVNAIVLRSSGPDFAHGGSLEFLEKITKDFRDRALIWREARDLAYAVVNCGKPIVSAIRGRAVSASLVSALLADISVAGRTAKIVDGHVQFGVAAGDHSAMVWPLLCGLAKSKYYLLLNDDLSGEEAERIGLVSICVDDEEVDGKAIEIAARLARGAQYAIRFTKYALNNWLRLGGPIFDTSLALEFVNFSAPDVVEGIAAMREQRPPRFEPTSPL